jgi:hypothetical protein
MAATVWVEGGESHDMSDHVRHPPFAYVRYRTDAVKAHRVALRDEVTMQSDWGSKGVQWWHARSWARPKEGPVAVNTAVSRSTRSTVLEHLRVLRGSISRARDMLMHYRDDRVDRDTLEPAARRVDELMNMFATNANDPALITLWSSEIQTAIGKVPNPKSADALHEASTELAAILDVIEAEEKRSQLETDYRTRF